jgi:hypothetical protein
MVRHDVLVAGRVTRLGEFSPIGAIVFLEKFVGGKFLGSLNFCGTVTYLCVNFDPKRLGLYFWRFFHKLIWSF